MYNDASFTGVPDLPHGYDRTNTRPPTHLPTNLLPRSISRFLHLLLNLHSTAAATDRNLTNEHATMISSSNGTLELLSQTCKTININNNNNNNIHIGEILAPWCKPSDVTLANSLDVCNRFETIT